MTLGVATVGVAFSPVGGAAHRDRVSTRRRWLRGV